MTKTISGDLYSDLITSSDPRAMACGSIPRQAIDRIVIHHNATTSSAVAISTWLANGAAQTSAHYEIDNEKIIGIVGEKTTAWHAGNANMNARSIGIENVNNSGAPGWTISNATFESLCKLVADIAKRYGFPIDSTHVIPHSAVVPTACPGGIDVNKVIKRANEIAKGETTVAKFKASQKVTLTGRASNSTYGTAFSKDVKGTWGKIISVNKLSTKKSNSNYSYLVAFWYQNDMSFWNVLEQDLQLK